MPHVFAYLDPGSGSLLIQAAIAAVVSVPILLRHKLAAAVGAFRRGDRRDSQTRFEVDGTRR